MYFMIKKVLDKYMGIWEIFNNIIKKQTVNLEIVKNI